MKHSLLALAAAAALSGCAGMQSLGADAVTDIVSEVTDVLMGPDTDYKNYLSTCFKEYKAYLDDRKDRNETTRVALRSPHKEIAFSAFVQHAVEGAQFHVPKCSVERKPGWLENTSIFDILLRVYQINRDGVYARKQLESSEKLGLRQISAQQESTRQLYNLITTLSGDKLELQRDARGASAPE
jgi:hypothetical protein